MTYDPQVNDYVKWKGHEGWVYFKSDSYITIEISTKPREFPFYIKNKVHYKHHTLLVCHSCNWSELQYVKSRKPKMDT